MSEMEYIVQLKGLKKKYYNTEALNDITVNIEKGKIIGLLGPNGSGKSTLLKSIAGLVKPTAGEVLINGSRPSSHTKVGVSYLPEIEYLYSWMTVGETLDFISSFYSNWQDERAKELLSFMELDINKKVKILSKGMRARLKLVISLARLVPLVLLDEPLSGIDPPSRTRILQSLVSQYRVGEQTIILSTHEVAESETIFEDVIFLHEGKIKLYDAAEHLRAQHGCSIQDLWEEVYGT